MWGGVTNLGSRRITNSFTRSQNMRENGIGGKEAQPKISPTRSKARVQTKRELCEKRGSLQGEPTKGKFWSKA